MISKQYFLLAKSQESMLKVAVSIGPVNFLALLPELLPCRIYLSVDGIVYSF